METSSRGFARGRFGASDLLIGALGLSLIYVMVALGSGMTAPIESGIPQIDLSVWSLPYYAGRSLLRMFIALGLSLWFSLSVGSLAAHSPRAERIILPLLDVFQSIPVLGFLSASVTALLALFPGSTLGPEAASIFAIFTSQVWNMTFSFHHSVSSIPQDLREAANVFGLSPWQRFWRLEVSYAVLPLVWNSMLSFGGGWFFLAASEAISVLNQDIRLPGLGSYLSVALVQRDSGAIFAAIVTMVGIIVLVDQLFWRPVVAWAQKFKLELSQSSGDQPDSIVLTALRRSALVQQISRWISPAWSRFNAVASRLSLQAETLGTNGTAFVAARKVFGYALAAVAFGLCAIYAYRGVELVLQLSAGEMLRIVGLGGLTLLRVAAATILGLLWTVPAGVAIGTRPNVSRFAQPLVQIASSFPANMVFPFITVLYLRLRVNFDIGSVPLMMLGTQWYILFNVIAGAMSMPSDLREAALVLRLKGLTRWKRLILPAIFPSIVTGCVTAWGGAWNASIVAEVVTWGDQTLRASGLGAYIADTTARGYWPGIIWGITVMSTMVVVVNRLFWHKLYLLSENKYRMS